MLYNSFKAHEEMQQLKIDEINDLKKKEVKPLHPYKQVHIEGVNKLEKYMCC